MLVLTLAMYGDVLLSPGRPVLSLLGLDMSNAELAWRIPAFEELSRGHIMQRNPYMFSGMPFFSESQIAILYPVNWIHLILPADRAVNLIIALHTFLVGLFTYLWGRYRGLSKLAGLLSGVIMMFGGPIFLHVMTGHANNLAAMAWAPLLFLSADYILDHRYRDGVLLGSFSLAMQVLAGQPQYVYFTAIALLLYGLLRLARNTNRIKAITAFLCVAIAGSILTAVQTISVLQAAGESIRSGSGGIPYQVAAAFSFPPENFLTLFMPQFFGNELAVVYWGKWRLWEASVFMGTTGFALVVYALLAAWNRARILLVMAFAMFLLALGSYSPLFPLLYAHVPGLNRFRGDAKFIFQAMLFMSLLAGVGLDALVEHGRRRRLAGGLALGAGVILVGAGICISLVAEDGPSGNWGQLMWGIWRNGGPGTPAHLAVLTSVSGVAQCGACAAASCCIGAVTLFVVATIFWAVRNPAKAVYLLAALGVAELFVAARVQRPTYAYGTSRAAGLPEYLAQHPGDYRYWEAREPNDALSLRTYCVWGADSNISKRYAEFFALTQGLNPNDFQALMWPTFKQFHPLCALLRWRYAFSFDPNGQIQVNEAKNCLPHVFLAQDYRVLTGRDRIFAAMTDAAFDPARTVILESPPVPAPAAGSAEGNARILNQTTDSLVIEADAPQPALLVITDSYSRYFEATPLPGSSQHHYDVLPADYTLMAIPLTAGRHHLRLEYMPSGYLIGRWISLAGWGGYLGILGVVLFSRQRFSKPNTQTPKLSSDSLGPG